MKHKFQALQRETIEGAGKKIETRGENNKVVVTYETLEVSRGDIFEADSEHSGILELLKFGTIQPYTEPPAPAAPAAKTKSGGES